MKVLLILSMLFMTGCGCWSIDGKAANSCKRGKLCKKACEVIGTEYKKHSGFTCYCKKGQSFEVNL